MKIFLTVSALVITVKLMAEHRPSATNGTDVIKRHQSCDIQTGSISFAQSVREKPRIAAINQ